MPWSRKSTADDVDGLRREGFEVVQVPVETVPAHTQTREEGQGRVDERSLGKEQFGRDKAISTVVELPEVGLHFR